MDPPSPKAILRGHSAQVHAATFTKDNARLVTGDAEGFIVMWDLSIMRPRAVWRAHEGSILGVEGWGRDKLITHGRDHKLIVWRIDEGNMSVAPPLEQAERPKPWVLHVLDVNAMNFCAFSACGLGGTVEGDAAEVLIAVPHTLASENIDIYSLPSQGRLHTVKTTPKNGMAMCTALLHLQGTLTLVAAFENGAASVHRFLDGWTTTYRTQAHAQPILSLAVHPDQTSFFTSGADAVIARHPIPLAPRDGQAWEHTLKTMDTKHAGQQGLTIRSDGRVLATAGWDGRARVYSGKTMKELAVLAWHKVGCYAVAVAGVPDESDGVPVGAVTVRDRRLAQAERAHWIAAGAKDGKVSLWDIY